MAVSNGAPLLRVARRHFTQAYFRVDHDPLMLMHVGGEIEHCDVWAGNEGGKWRVCGITAYHCSITYQFWMYYHYSDIPLLTLSTAWKNHAAFIFTSFRTHAQMTIHYGTRSINQRAMFTLFIKLHTHVLRTWTLHLHETVTTTARRSSVDEGLVATLRYVSDFASITRTFATSFAFQSIHTRGIRRERIW